MQGYAQLHAAAEEKGSAAEHAALAEAGMRRLFLAASALRCSSDDAALQDEGGFGSPIDGRSGDQPMSALLWLRVTKSATNGQAAAALQQDAMHAAHLWANMLKVAS